MQTGPSPSGTDGLISDETRRRAEAARRAAAGLPSGSDVLTMVTDALARPGTDLSMAQIRQLGAVVVDQAQQISYLLGQLAGLDGDTRPARAGECRGQ